MPPKNPPGRPPVACCAMNHGIDHRQALRLFAWIALAAAVVLSGLAAISFSRLVIVDPIFYVGWGRLHLPGLSDEVRISVLDLPRVPGTSAWDLVAFPSNHRSSGSVGLAYPIIILSVLCRHLFRISRTVKPNTCECGYDLTGNVSGRCPECGQPTLPESP